MDLLFIEDEVQVLENYRPFLQSYFKNVYEATNIKDAYKIYNERKPDVIISDIHLENGNGLDFIKRIRQNDLSTKVIIISAYKREQYLFDAIELNLTKYLVKPIKGKELKSLIKNVVNDSIKSNIVELKNGYVWCLNDKRLYHDGEEVALTKNEIIFLKTFCKKKKGYFLYDDIYYTLYDDLEDYNPNKVRMIIKRLRQKTYKDFIVNIYGLGYTFSYK